MTIAPARYILGRDGDYLLPVKGNTPTLQGQVAAALAGINTLTTAADHIDEQHSRGQIYRRSLWLADATDVQFPGAAQAYLLRRDVFDLDGVRRRKQIVHGITSLRPPITRQRPSTGTPEVIGPWKTSSTMSVM